MEEERSEEDSTTHSGDEIQKNPWPNLEELFVFKRTKGNNVIITGAHKWCAENEKLLKAVIVAGLYPKVAKIRPSLHKKRPMPVKVYTKADGKVCIHPKSVNAEETQFHYTWLIYHLKMRTSSIFLYDCTEVSPFSLLFFGGDISIQKDQEQETIAVDEWIVFQSPARIAHLVKSLKKELAVLLEEKIRRPRPVDWDNRSSSDCAVISAIIDLITTQECPDTPAGHHQQTRKSSHHWDY